MKRMIKIAAILIALAAALVSAAQRPEVVTYRGVLKLGAPRSAIYYLGRESGDLVAFCFPNTSGVGRRILRTCRGERECEFTGRVDWAADCKGGSDLSAQGRIVSIRTVRLIRKARPSRQF